MATRKRNTVDLGRVHTDLGTGVPGWKVEAPTYTDENEARLTDSIGSIRITVMTTGTVVLRLGDKALVSINAGDLDTLGLALIKAGAR